MVRVDEIGPGTNTEMMQPFERPAPAPDARPFARVLVVDDVPEVARIVRHSARQVRSRNVEVVSEVNAARAYDIVGKEDFDLVISDFRMREVDGLQLLARAHEKNPEGKRILLTGYAASIGASPSLTAAALDGCLEKPMAPSVLAELLDAILAGDAATMAALKRGLEAKIKATPPQ